MDMSAYKFAFCVLIFVFNMPYIGILSFLSIQGVTLSIFNNGI